MISPTVIPLSSRDLEARIQSLRAKAYDEGVVAVHSRAPWTGGSTLRTSDGVEYRVAACPTLLALRWELSQLDDSPWTFLITPLRTDDLPLDVRSRLVPYQGVYQLDPAESLRALFAASRQHGDLVGDRRDSSQILAFLQSSDSKVEPAPLGVLSSEHLYGQVLQKGVFRRNIHALRDLLSWSLTPAAAADWEHFTTALSDDVQGRALDWLRRKLGPQSVAVVETLANRGPAELLTFGFLAEVLSAQALTHAADQASALGGFRVITRSGIATGEQLGAWARASKGMLDSSASEQAWASAQEAEHLLVSAQGLGQPSLVPLSTVFRGSLEARLSAFAHAATTALRTRELNSVLQALEDIRAHRLVTRQQILPVVESLARLLGWLAAPEVAHPESLSGWLTHYRDDLSWVDTCVNRAWDGTSNTELITATREITTAVRQRRQVADRGFARVLAASGTQREAAGDTLLIEDVLSEVVFPVHQGKIVDENLRPVLLLVIDGASVGVHNDILSSIQRTYPGDWQEMASDRGELRAALAALPTVTNYSRTSLLSGRLAAGGQNIERENLRAAYSSTFKKQGPQACRLLHKDDLATGINDHVKELVEDTQSAPFIAAVLNTVDDALGGSNPMGRTWGVKDIRHLGVLLEGAHRVGRTVILTSDHGHIAEKDHAGIVPTETTISARWRTDDLPAGPNEIGVAGDRVLANSGSIVLAVDEDVRYTAKKAGYHGGGTLAEAIAPVSVLAQTAAAFGADTAFPAVALDRLSTQPEWWSLSMSEQPSTRAPLTSKMQPPSARPDPLSLFDEQTPAPTAAQDRYAKLAGTGMFKERVDRHPVAGRKATEVADLLRKIDANNDRLPVTVVRDTWSLTPLMVRGVLAELRRIVNVDGVEALSMSGEDLVLYPELLFEQFGVK